MAAEKSRWFAFLVYPSSAPVDWWEWCKSTHGQFCRSPLHHADDEEMHDHYHVMYRHPNTVRLDYVRRLLSPVAANGFVEVVVNPSGMMRYLVHMDDGEKEQFVGDPFRLCECLGGFPLDFVKEYTAAEKREQRDRIITYIRRTGIVDYAHLVFRLEDEGLYELKDYACNHSVFLTALLRSARHAMIPVDTENPDNVSYVKLSEVMGGDLADDCFGNA